MAKIDIKNRGFTIVELLVVIVVIGILAAITMVSYSGISTKAKVAQEQANINSFINVMEVAYAETGSYPATTTAIENYNGSAKLPSNINVTTDNNITSSNFNTIIFFQCAASSNTCSDAIGGAVTSYVPGGGATIIYYGKATAASTFFTPAS